MSLLHTWTLWILRFKGLCCWKLKLELRDSEALAGGYCINTYRYVYVVVSIHRGNTTQTPRNAVAPRTFPANVGKSPYPYIHIYVYVYMYIYICIHVRHLWVIYQLPFWIQKKNQAVSPPPPAPRCLKHKFRV